MNRLPQGYNEKSGLTPEQWRKLYENPDNPDIKYYESRVVTTSTLIADVEPYKQ
jgi:hypothetical protein